MIDFQQNGIGIKSKCLVHRVDNLTKIASRIMLLMLSSGPEPPSVKWSFDKPLGLSDKPQVSPQLSLPVPYSSEVNE